MDWGRRIRDWKGSRLVREWRVRLWSARQQPIGKWEGWRRYSPAAGSVLAHGVVGLAIVSIFGASAKPRPAPLASPTPQLEVMLIAETPAPSLRPKANAPARAPAPDIEPIPERSRSVTPRRDATRAPEATAKASDAEAVYIPPSILNDAEAPLGLQGLLNADRCSPKKGLKPADCDAQWSAKVSSPGAWQTASKEDLRQHYAEFMPVCPYKVGCEPGDGVLLNGARSFGLKSPMASGAGGLQGIHDLVGRLPQKPDFVDPGFGD
jgi:hypothetical protein